MQENFVKHQDTLIEQSFCKLFLHRYLVQFLASKANYSF